MVLAQPTIRENTETCVNMSLSNEEEYFNIQQDICFFFQLIRCQIDNSLTELKIINLKYLLSCINMFLIGN